MGKKCSAFHAVAAHFTPPKGGFVARGAHRSKGVGTVRPMQLTPVIAIHLCAASSAFLIGPWVIWARRGAQHRPRLHRAMGYAWVTLMLMTAFSAMFIRDNTLPNIAGYTPIHLLVPVTLVTLFLSFRHLARRDIRRHRLTIVGLYIGACVVAGSFTLLPSRYLGGLLWRGLGLI
jgi:uncharacterized membrane protein